jgi:RHS repeat-associated protein
VWRWDQAEPFGANPADANPSGLGAFDLPLRLPGQRYDQETGLHYNYFRDYDPSLGRYGESDPVGLKGGINSYLYVHAAPVALRDPLGLFWSPAHYYMTYSELRKIGVNPIVAETLAWHSAAADWRPGGWRTAQLMANANRHGLAIGDEGPAAAYRGTQTFIATEIAKCTAEGVGNALHAAQDTKAGGHNYQPYFGGPVPPIHFFRDILLLDSEVAGARLQTRRVIAQTIERCGCLPTGSLPGIDPTAP